MARRKNVVNLDAEDDAPVKMWKANPPGPEQKELNRMFEKGIIGASDTAAKVRLRNEMFLPYPPKTFPLHFRVTKAKYGLNAGPTSSNAIAELGGLEEEPKRSSTSPVAFLETQLEAKNFPYMAWTYTDHVEQKDIVCVAVPIVTGSRDIKFVISEDGMQLMVEYVWPSTFLDPIELFYDVTDDDGSAISMSHAMVYSFRNHLDQLDLSDKCKPNASLVVTLPMKVQKELGTFKKEALKCGETRVVLLRLTAYQKKRAIHEADTTIKF